DIFWSFVLMGWTAFGGPAAHIGIFEKVFVEAKRWMSPTVFNELLSLGQCMPGPTSTQVSFAIGVVQKGIPGGLMSGMLFQYPGLLMMSLAGAGAAEILVNPDAWLRGLSAGLSAAGVALVVSAAVGLAKGQCKDQITSALCLMSATIAYYYQSNWIFPLLIVVGGLTTLYTKRNDDVALPDRKEQIHHLGLSKLSGGILIVAWLVIWIAVASVVNTSDYDGNEELYWFEAFYRTGSIIFGGGQVVLPLLLKDVVPRANSWITEEQFFAGLGVVQAMPGPLFNLSAYIGALAARRAGINVLAGIFAAWFGLFGPGVMLIYGVLPFWGAFRKQPVYRRALPGLNSSAVGLVVAAVFQMSFKV
ncbi:chromate ion transporter family, partial [Micromonas commoda]